MVQAIYTILKPFHFILKQFKGFVTNTTSIGETMINAVVYGYDKTIIENKDINVLAKSPI